MFDKRKQFERTTEARLDYIVKSIEYGKELTSWGSPEETIVNLEEV